jgi:hypothetical protein
MKGSTTSLGFDTEGRNYYALIIVITSSSIGSVNSDGYFGFLQS